MKWKMSWCCCRPFCCVAKSISTTIHLVPSIRSIATIANFHGWNSVDDCQSAIVPTRKLPSICASRHCWTGPPQWPRRKLPSNCVESTQTIRHKSALLVGQPNGWPPARRPVFHRIEPVLSTPGWIQFQKKKQNFDLFIYFKGKVWRKRKCKTKQNKKLTLTSDLRSAWVPTRMTGVSGEWRRISGNHLDRIQRFFFFFFLKKRKIIKQVRKKKTSCWRNVIPTSISGMTSFLSFYLALILFLFTWRRR